MNDNSAAFHQPLNQFIIIIIIIIIHILFQAMLSSPRSWLSSAEIRLLFVLLLPEPIKSALTPVPLFDSPTKARFASVRLRVYPLTKI